MIHSTPEVHLHTRANRLISIARKLKSLDSLFRHFDNADQIGASCLFSDPLNLLSDQIARLDEGIRTIAVQIERIDWRSAETDAVAKTDQLTKRLGLLERIRDQLGDLACLMECAVDAANQNPHALRRYFAERFRAFGMQLHAEGEGILKDLEQTKAADKVTS